MRTLALLALMTVAGRAEVITYWLHGATIGNDPNHAVDAEVEGRFDFDPVARAITGVGMAFQDIGAQGEYYLGGYSSPLYFMAADSSTSTSVHLLGCCEKYLWFDATVSFAQMGSPRVNLDLQNSYVNIEECARPGPGGCSSLVNSTVRLNFTGGYLSTDRFTEPARLFAPSFFAAPVANPEPGTWISGMCGCLLAIWMKRTNRRRL